MQKLLVGLLIMAVLFEGTITSLPLVLMMLIITATQIHSTNIFLVGFVGGIVLDIVLIRPIGETSSYFLIILFLMSMYEKKYEVGSALFVTIFTFIASGIYFLIFPAPQRLLQIGTITAIAFIGFYLLQTVNRRRMHTSRL